MPPEQSEMHIVHFASSMMTFIMARAETTELRLSSSAGWFAEIGNTRFTGKTEEELWEKIFEWILNRKPTLSPVEYEVKAEPVLKEENAETNKLIDVLTEGGMSEEGKEIQEARDKLANTTVEG